MQKPSARVTDTLRWHLDTRCECILGFCHREATTPCVKVDRLKDGGLELTDAGMPSPLTRGSELLPTDTGAHSLTLWLVDFAGVLLEHSTCRLKTLHAIF